ncbi:MAG: hypothetical protein ACK6EB_08105, partial [Planctomyces sp.]
LCPSAYKWIVPRAMLPVTGRLSRCHETSTLSVNRAAASVSMGYGGTGDRIDRRPCTVGPRPDRTH